MTDLPEIGALYQHQASGKNYRVLGMGDCLEDVQELTDLNIYPNRIAPASRKILAVTPYEYADKEIKPVYTAKAASNLLNGDVVVIYGGQRNWVRSLAEFMGEKDGKPRFRKLEPVSLNYFERPIEWDLRSKGSSEVDALPTARFGIYLHVNPGLLPHLTHEELQFSDQVVVEFQKTMEGHTRIDIWFTSLDGRKNDWNTRSTAKQLAFPVLEYVNNILSHKLALLPTEGEGTFLA